MTHCRFDLDSVSAALDHALSEEKQTAFAAHLPCPSCTPLMEALSAARHALRRIPAREEPSGAVRARVEAMGLRSLGSLRRPSQPRWRLIGVVAVGAVASFGVFSFLLTRTPETVPAAEVMVADHLRSVPEVRPAEVTSDDPEVVARFFEGHVAFRASVPKLPDARLLGGRLCRIEGKLTELLFYEHQQEVLSLFVAGVPLGVEGCASARGHQVCTARRGEVGLTLVGKLRREEAERLLADASL